MEGLGLLLLLWIISTVFEKFRDAQRKAPPGELPPARSRNQRAERRAGRLERVPASPPPPSPAESGEEEWRKELERIFGIPGQGGPVGRHGDAPIPPAEEVEEAESLESEPELVNVDEVALERPAPVAYDQDDSAEELVRRRVAVADARSGGLTKADHARFDRMVRSVPAPADQTAVKPRRFSVRQAFIWKEILDPPVGMRRGE